MDFKLQFLWVVAGLGLAALVGLFKNMKGGLTPRNVQVFLATLTLLFGILVSLKDESLAFLSALVVGALVGYAVGRESLPMTREDLSQSLETQKTELLAVLPKAADAVSAQNLKDSLADLKRELAAEMPKAAEITDRMADDLNAAKAELLAAMPKITVVPGGQNP